MTDSMHGVLSCYAGLLVEDIRRVTDVYVRYGQYGFVRCRLFIVWCVCLSLGGNGLEWVRMDIIGVRT